MSTQGREAPSLASRTLAPRNKLVSRRLKLPLRSGLATTLFLPTLCECFPSKLFFDLTIMMLTLGQHLAHLLYHLYPRGSSPLVEPIRHQRLQKTLSFCRCHHRL